MEAESQTKKTTGIEAAVNRLGSQVTRLEKLPESFRECLGRILREPYGEAASPEYAHEPSTNQSPLAEELEAIVDRLDQVSSSLIATVDQVDL